MRMRTLGIAAVFIFAAALSLAAQDNVPAVAPVTDVAISAPSDWRVVVETSGGFTGRGVGGFSLAASGQLTCDGQNPCNRQVPAAALKEIAALLSSLDSSKWTRQFWPGDEFRIATPFSMCNDCIVTTLSLWIRDSKGGEKSYSVSWDPTTQASVPPEILRIFNTATALSR